MKKTAILFAMVLGLFASANDLKKVSPTLTSYKVVKVPYKNVNPFCISIFKNDFETVKKLIELGVNVNEFSSNKSPLMYAARYNRVEMIKLLIANGAQLELKDAKGFNALKYAELANAKEAKALLERLMKERS